MTVIVLQWLGLILLCYGVWRFVMSVVDGITRREELRDVMEGRAIPTWESDARIVRIWDEDYDPGIVPTRRGVYDWEKE